MPPPPSARPLTEEPSHENRDAEDQHSSDDVPAVEPPQRGALVSDDAAWGKPALTDAPALELPAIEQIAGRPLVNDGKALRFFPPEDAQGKVSGLRSLRLLVEEPSSHDAMPKIRFRPAVDGSTR